MANAITDKDIYSGKPNPFEDAVKGGEILLKEMDKIIAKGKELSSVTIGDIKSNPKQTAEDLKQLTIQTSKLNEINKATLDIDKQKKLLQDQLKRSTDEEVKARLRYNEAVKQQKKEITQLLRFQKAEKESIDKLNAANAILRNRVRGISSATEEGRKRIDAYNKVIDRNTIKIKQLSDTQTRQLKNVGNYGSALQGVGSALGIVTGATALAATAIRKSIDVTKQAIEVNREFEKTFANVLTLLDEADKKEFGDILAIGAVDIMANYGLEISDVNNALFDTISNGIEAGNAIEFLDKSARLAIAGNAQLSDVIKGATKVYTVYKDEVESVDEILNAFFAAQVDGATNVGLLANNIGKLAGTAKKAGIPINELFGTFAGLTKFLDGTEESATTLVNVINSLIKTTPEVEKQFKQLGIETGITAIKQNGLLKTVLQVVKATEENEDALTDLIPNIRAFKGIAGLSAETIAELEENIAKLNDQELSATLLQEAFNEQMGTGQKQAELLSGSWKRLLITVGGGESIFKKIGTAIRADLNKEITNLTKNIELLKLTWDRFFGDLTKEDYQKAVYELEVRFGNLAKGIDETNESTKEGEILTKQQIALIIKYNTELEKNLTFNKENYEIAKKYYDIIPKKQVKETETLEILKKRVQELEKEKAKISTNDIQRLISKDKEIEKIKEEISILENLNKVLSEQDKDFKIDIDLDLKFDDTGNIFDDLEKEQLEDINNFTKEALKARESIYDEHYDNIFDIFSNYATKRKIEGQNLSAAEINEINETNQKQYAAASELVSSLVNLYNAFLESRLNQLQSEIDAQNQAINEREQALNRELELQRSGSASNVQIEKERLKNLQEERNKNLEEQRKLQKQQENINLAVQASELVTAIANVIAGYSEIPIVGVLLGLAAAATLVTGFLSSKSDAEGAVKFADGGAFIEGGKYHSQGGNKYGKYETEKDEGHIIISRENTKKLGINGLNQLADIANDESKWGFYKENINNLKSNNVIINNDYNNLLREQRETNRILKKGVFAVKKGNDIVFFSHDGKRLGTNLY